MYLLKSKIHYYDYALEKWALDDVSYRKFGKPEDVKVYADIRDIPPEEVVRDLKEVYSKVLLVKK